MVFSAGARGEDKSRTTARRATGTWTITSRRKSGPRSAPSCACNATRQGGDAEESKFILQDPRKVQGHAQDEAMRHNRDAFARLARVKEGDQSRLLVKVTGGLDHGGADVLKPDSTGYRILAEFVRRVNAPPSTASRPVVGRQEPAAVLRRRRRCWTPSGCSGASRSRWPAGCRPRRSWRPSPRRGSKALPPLLDALMKEDAFYDRLREGFNDIFLTLGIDGNAEADGPVLRALREDAHCGPRSTT